jgi:hypothetical protein
MKGTQLALILVAVVLVIGYSVNAEADAILSLSDTSVAGSTKTCDTSMAFSATNCGTGFAAVPGGSSIVYTGVLGGNIGGFSITSVTVIGNQPGTAVAGNVTNAETGVLHLSGTGNLQVDFGGNNFSLPAGPGLFLSAADAATFGQSQATDMKNFVAWGRATNDFVIPGGTATAVAPGCVPGAGTATACSAITANVGFTRGAGNYALTGRDTIVLSAANQLPANFTATAVATAQPIMVPEPVSALTLGIAGLLLLAANRRMSRKYGRR